MISTFIVIFKSCTWSEARSSPCSMLQSSNLSSQMKVLPYMIQLASIRYSQTRTNTKRRVSANFGSFAHFHKAVAIVRSVRCKTSKIKYTLSQVLSSRMHPIAQESQKIQINRDIQTVSKKCPIVMHTFLRVLLQRYRFGYSSCLK